MGDGGLVLNIVASIAFLILVFLVANNSKGFVAIMNAGGPQVVNLVKTLQAR
jgi:hypothetical protein